MKSKANFKIFRMVLFAACFAPACNAQNTQTAPLDEQLKAQYTLIPACGASGTALVVQKPGIAGTSRAMPATLTSKYQNGKLQGPPDPGSCKFCTFLPNPLQKGAQAYQQTKQDFNVNLKVYPASIQVNLSKDAVTMGILACDLGAKANIQFQFSKGALQKMSVPEVVDVISQVLAFDQQQDPPQQAVPTTPDQSASSEPQAEAPTIQIGETIDQVIAAFGQPEKKVNLGSKQIFMYKNLKVTFKDGKVTEAE